MLNFILRKLQNVQVCHLRSLKAHVVAERDRGKRVRQKAPFLFKVCANACCRAEKYISGYSEVGIAPGLGPGDRAFEPHYSDQNPSEIVDFRGIFLFFVYCGAKFEGK